MKPLLWSVGAILFLALVNAIATWLGHDVAEAEEEPHEPHAPAHATHVAHASPAPAAAAHSHSPHP